ncbi:MAG: phytase [Chitinophagaceae bacterium]|nr:phytase [Chitinophagaceae bacterium]
MRGLLYYFVILIVTIGCNESVVPPSVGIQISDSAIKPFIITDTVQYDTDDPAIWINKNNPAESLIVGTDKAEDGALYVFNLQGKIQSDKIVRGLKRPNNVDIEYGFILQNRSIDIIAVTERITHKLRIFSVPDMTPIDGGGLDMFQGDTAADYRDLMGIALYKDRSGRIFAIVGRKNGPRDGQYLAQYLLESTTAGQVTAKLIRKFGQFSGKKEIESIAVDDELGYIYYSDEGFGVRKYFADPTKGNDELAVLGETGFEADHEGISIFSITDTTGYIIVSDQQANRFQLFSREGTPGKPHQHRLIKSVLLSTDESDGSDVTSLALNSNFKKGLFVAMSTNKTFQFYKWEDIMP